MHYKYLTIWHNKFARFLYLMSSFSCYTFKFISTFRQQFTW